MTDGKGTLYFVACQATKMTRDELRASSPSGRVEMDSWLGRSFTVSFLGWSLAAGFALTYMVDWLAM